MIPSELDVLRNAREFLSNPEHWCKGYMRHDQKCCMLGALHYAPGNDNRVPARIVDGAADALLHCLPDNILGSVPDPEQYMIADYNDSSATTYSDVMAVYNRAIEKLEKELEASNS